MPKYVVSSTLDEATWNNSTILRGDLSEALARLKQEVEGDILVNGSCMLVHSLIEQDLLDELRLMVFPVILGSGRRVFPDTPEKTVLELADTRTYGSVVVHAFQPAGRR
jgi:dihydrofolate reductase